MKELRKNIQGGFVEFQKNFIDYILIREMVRKQCMEVEIKVRRIIRKGIEYHNTVTMINHRESLSMVCWKNFYLVVGGIVSIVIAKISKT